MLSATCVVLKSHRGHPGLNRGPLDLQSNALPLSYIPNAKIEFVWDVDTSGDLGHKCGQENRFPAPGIEPGPPG